MTGYIFIYLDDAIVMRFALSMLYIPAVLVLVDAKSKAGRFLDYHILTAVSLWGVFYAIYWRRPFGFSLIFCAIVGFIYYVIFTDKAPKDKMSKILIVNGCFIALVFLIALSLNLMFNPRHAPLLNGGTVMW